MFRPSDKYDFVTVCCRKSIHQKLQDLYIEETSKQKDDQVC